MYQLEKVKHKTLHQSQTGLPRTGPTAVVKKSRGHHLAFDFSVCTVQQIRQIEGVDMSFSTKKTHFFENHNSRELEGLYCRNRPGTA